MASAAASLRAPWACGTWRASVCLANLASHIRPSCHPTRKTGRQGARGLRGEKVTGTRKTRPENRTRCRLQKAANGWWRANPV